MTEIEAVLNSRSLTYFSTDNLEEPWTPSNLLLGYRVLSLPDPILSDDPDYDDNLEEPWTPSNLLLGYRVLSLPDPILSDDPDYDESPNDLGHRMKHLLKTSEKFWKHWKKEYLVEL